MTELYEGVAITITQQQFNNFNSKIDKKDNGCWEWLGYKNERNYGTFPLRNHSSGKETWITHRLSYLLFVGRIKKDFQIDHLCMNKSCVNPDHLESVTAKENTRRYKATVKQKQICVHGHSEYIISPKGKRYCGVCNRIRANKYYKDKKNA